MIRTTMTLEPDDAEALERRAQRTGQPFRRNVNEVLRLGLQAEKAPGVQNTFGAFTGAY